MIEQRKKALPLMILHILTKYSDESHPLTQQDIIDLINKEYNIDCDRRTVGANIEVLEDFGYDIISDNKKGTYLGEREFDKTEVRFIVDALFASKSLNSKNTEDIAKKIMKFLSKYDKQDYKYVKKSNDINKSDQNVLYFIDTINDAIAKKKMIGFNYIEYDKKGKEAYRYNGYQYKVSPYYLISNSGRYYLLCSYRKDKFNDIQTYRVDYLRNVQILDIDSVDISTIPGHESFNITKYMNEHIYPFGGGTISAKLELKDPKAIQYVKDWFGSKANIGDQGDKIIASVTSNENALFYWLMQYSAVIKVLEPESLRNKIRDAAKEMLDYYK